MKVDGTHPVSAESYLAGVSTLRGLIRDGVLVLLVAAGRGGRLAL